MNVPPPWCSRLWLTKLEALPPELLAGLLTDAIEAFLDALILVEDREVEARERRQIARALPCTDV